MAIKLNNVLFNLGASFQNFFFIIHYLEKQDEFKQTCLFGYLVL
jgi:hypothetical protein